MSPHAATLRKRAHTHFAQKEADLSRGTETILLVDDDEPVQYVVREFLSESAIGC